MTDREKLIGLIVEIENEIIKAYPYTTDEFRIEKIVDHLLAHSVRVQEWIPVKDRLPKDDSPVLVYKSKYSEAYGNMETAYYNQKRWIGCIGDNITHWMSLPEPPKGKIKIPCIMPEMPYCPACKYGYITKSEDVPDTDCEWVCLYKGEENKTDAPIELVRNHGEWIPVELNRGLGTFTGIRCSLCDFERIKSSLLKAPNYCENCGAKMKERNKLDD